MKYRFSTRYHLTLLILSSISTVSFSQINDSIINPFRFGGAFTITTKGISLIPNLTLGKPAAIFDLSMGKGRFSFEPQLRFALDGKPWTFIFWGKYEVYRSDRFTLRTGLHPAFAFKTITDTTGGEPTEMMRAQRYLAGELVPTWFITKSITVGLYYLYSHGLEKDIVQNTNYIGLRCGFTNIRISDGFYLRFSPQVYYLKMDENDGFYLNATLTLARNNFPLTVSSLVNQTLTTEIPVGEDFIWNISLTYTFTHEYVRK
jgi:hypothetical protein